MESKEPKKSVPLTIYLIKEEFDKADEIISEKAAHDPIKINIPGCPSLLFVERSNNFHPAWVSLFSEFVDPTTIPKIASLSALLLAQTKDRYFALTFGNGRFLLRPEVLEERFGLLVALNSVDEDSFRVIDKQSLDPIQSHSRIQSGRATTPDRFGLDVEQDLLRAVVGKPKSEKLGARMTGADSLGVSVRMDLPDLPYLLNAYREKFEQDISGTIYSWVNNIAILKKTSQAVSNLDELLVEKFSVGDHSNLWLSIPEIIDWSNVKGFIFTRGKGVVHPDITLPDFLDTTTSQAINLELLLNSKVSCADEDHRRMNKNWPVYKCIYTEIDYEGDKYVLNGGTWFKISIDFVNRTNEVFDKIKHSKLEMPVYSGGGESDYNAYVASINPNKFALLDNDIVYHGGSQGKVEICDLFSIDKELIHIKRYLRSDALSHLFSQGLVSGQLLQLDAEFRKKVKDKLSAPYDSLINFAVRPADKEFTVVYGVISRSQKPGLHLPFFSRVNINNATKTLEGFGYKVRILRIQWDEKYAKTKYGPPAKVKKL